MKEKWGALVLGIMFVSIFGSMAIGDYTKEKASIEKAKAGLEECPVDPESISNQTIWVKDCNSYMKTVKEKE